MWGSQTPKDPQGRRIHPHSDNGLKFEQATFPNYVFSSFNDYI